MFSVNTHPNIQFVMHFAARHSHSPKMSHKKAVKQIVRCLKDSLVEGKDPGLTFDVGKAEDSLGIDCFVDADFAGLW